MKSHLLLASVVLLAAAALAQDTSAPIFLGRATTMIAPCADASGKRIVFGSAIAPDGANPGTVDLYTAFQDGSGLRQLTHLARSEFLPQGANAVSLTPDGLWAAFSNTTAIGRTEEVHLVDVARGIDKTLAVNTQGCIQPLLCVNCFFSCLRTPHVTPDGSAVLYYASRQSPFYLVKNDGSKPLNLPVYSGYMAPSGKRVISANGRVVFASSAPAGPTFAAAPTQVYLMNLDGTGIKQVTSFGDPSVYAQDATISADGSTIAFLSNLDPVTGKASQSMRLFTIRADGTALRQVTSGGTAVSSSSLSGDGSRLAFASQGQILVVVGSSNAARVLTRFQFSVAQDPVISDDGSVVTFGIGPQDGSIGAIYSVSADGGSPVPVYAPRSLLPGGIAGAVAGSITSAYGTNLSDDSITQAPSLPLPLSLDGMSLAMNGSPLPLLATSPWQINAQIPPQSEGPAAFTVPLASGGPSAAVKQDVQAVGPSIFLLPSVRSNQAAALHGATGVVVDTSHPAAAGDVIAIYATGLGPTTPVVPAGTGAPASPLAQTVSRPVANIGGKTAQVLFSGLTPGLVGVYQVNVIVPDGMRAGDNYVSLQIGSTSGQGGIITTK